MAKDEHSSPSGAKLPEDRREPLYCGPRPRWTELIRQNANRHKTLIKLAQAILLVYAFLAAINMMGVGVRLTALNPGYVGGLGDAALEHKPRDADANVTRPRDLAEAERAELKAGLKVGVISAIRGGSEGSGQAGSVLYGEVTVPAILAGGLPEHKQGVTPGGAAVVVAVEDDHVIVEPLCEYKDWLYAIFTYAKNPFLALLVGIMITAIFQSSSFTTSFTVGLVATIDFPIASAIPVVMGANIGTSVTCIIVALGYVRQRDEFRRAFAGATVHDFFKLLSVGVLFTIEIIAHPLQWAASKIAGVVYQGGAGVTEPTNFIKEAVRPVVEGFQALLTKALNIDQGVAGIIMTVVAVALLFGALLLLVKVLQSLVLQRAEGFFDRVLFRNAGVAFFVGLVLTAAVQSSSVTTSLAVPLIAAGLLTIRQVFPYFLGANIGTTVTALVAAFATGAATESGARMGLTLACVHVLFNCLGALIFYPLRWLPITLAEALAVKAAQSKRYAILFIVGVFFGIPLLGIACHWLIGKLF